MIDVLYEDLDRMGVGKEHIFKEADPVVNAQFYSNLTEERPSPAMLELLQNPQREDLPYNEGFRWLGGEMRTLTHD